jgi:hypothetical protein
MYEEVPDKQYFFNIIITSKYMILFLFFEGSHCLTLNHSRSVTSKNNPGSSKTTQL